MPRLALTISFFWYCQWLYSQPFNIVYEYKGNQVHNVIRQLADSSYVSLTAVGLFNDSIFNFDTFETLLIRYDKAGHIRYRTKLKSISENQYQSLGLAI